MNKKILKKSVQKLDIDPLCDTKEDEESQKIHEKQIDNFIQILDSYRRSIIVCKKKYDDIRWKE